MSLSSWHFWLGSETGVVAATVAALPAVVVAVWVLAHHRVASGRSPADAWRTAVTEVGAVYGTVPWVWLTMLPGGRAGAVTGAVSLVPLRDLATMDSVQVVGNLLIFAALGALLPWRFAALASVPRITALAGLGSIVIEVAQYVLRLDRVSSVDDVLLNAVGGGIAACLSVALLRLVALVRSRSLRPMAPATTDG